MHALNAAHATMAKTQSATSQATGKPIGRVSQSSFARLAPVAMAMRTNSNQLKCRIATTSARQSSGHDHADSPIVTAWSKHTIATPMAKGAKGGRVAGTYTLAVGGAGNDLPSILLAKLYQHHNKEGPPRVSWWPFISP